MRSDVSCHVNLKERPKHENREVIALAISVGQPDHEGERFKASVDLLAELVSIGYVRKIIILVGDTLQRHNQKISPSGQDARKNGDDWLKRNQASLDILRKACLVKSKEGIEVSMEMVRWDTYLNDPRFRTYADKVAELYRNEEEFRQKIEETVEVILKRKKGKWDDSPRTRDICRDYIKEELAAYLIWCEEGYHQIFYPNKVLPSFQWLHEYYVKKQEYYSRETVGVWTDFSFRTNWRPNKNVHHFVGTGHGLELKNNQLLLPSIPLQVPSPTGSVEPSENGGSVEPSVLCLGDSGDEEDEKRVSGQPVVEASPTDMPEDLQLLRQQLMQAFSQKTNWPKIRQLSNIVQFVPSSQQSSPAHPTPVQSPSRTHNIFGFMRRMRRSAEPKPAGSAKILRPRAQSQA